jgi:nucleotidyltransferase substrate binding protein (TIGR01987 family)
VSTDPDIRWKQRFQNFDRAFRLLEAALKDGAAGLSVLEKEGVVQRFEYTFELAWKTVKDYLEAGGLILATVTPRQVLKEAFAAKVLAEGQVWIDMLDHRNLLSHTYDSSVFEEAATAIAGRYLPSLKQLHAFFSGKEAE